MPELTVRVGGKSYLVACQPGEEPFLESAAGYLDAEAQILIKQIKQLPENRMLLMAGLMLADKTAAMEDKSHSGGAEVSSLKARIAELEGDLATLRAQDAAAPSAQHMPQDMLDQMAELAAQAEAAAETLERNLKP
ncbi:MAG: cell division protein ZapA [Pseudomonadota bacterium]